MKTIILTYIFLLIGTLAYSQQSEHWTVFWDKKEESFGFKDQNGRVQIQPKFSNRSVVDRLDHVFIASEGEGVYADFYYLTKSGKSFGRDSAYTVEATPDCECEGFIRFRDLRTEKVGMFNRNGKVVIPAIYNHLSQVKNGLVIALIDAKKEFREGHDHSGCNHFSWTGGKTMLIDTTNTAIIEKFTFDLDLDLYSHLLQDNSEEDPNREYFAGFDGIRHSFVSYRKDFSYWLQQSLLDNFTLENLKQEASTDLAFWENADGWRITPSKKLLEKHFSLIKERLSIIKELGQDFSITLGGLNSGVFEGKEYDMYFDNCGTFLVEKYPVMQVVIPHKKGKGIYQNQFEFLKTEKGYKLISVSMDRGE
ncbi:WG repeat-containing protein [Rufibacter tibetensis]|uniref:WG repeat-containing protein n=1 Tax=Rufibacter tibetensis TaxID=512763 RepID=A0A0P0D0Z3_9BACT|nr:WG repeat-containing protein [Rufibacter tibetensis]ALJ00718.1 hypothetical protein DC20_19220 [Rufibacter tibetensis]